MKGQVRIEY